MKINKILFLLLTVFISIDLQAYIYTANNFDELRQPRQSQKLQEWKVSYFQKSDNLFVDIKGQTRGIVEIASDENNFSEVFNLLSSVHDKIYLEEKEKGAENIEAYLSSFVSNSINSFGLSQFVLETAMACRLFAYSDSSNSFRSKACLAYPVLASATAKLAFEKAPARRFSFERQGIHSQEVDTGRGLVLTRALHPLFNAYMIDDKTINGTNWSLSIRDKFKKAFLHSNRLINASLKDFFALKFVDYRLSNQTEDEAFSDMLSVYNPTTIIAECINRQRLKILESPATSRIRRCTSNHIIAGYFGRFMNRVVQGQSLNSSFIEFKSIVDHSIVYDQSNYFMTDLYRKFENKGITYSLLQLRFITAAAEIMENNGMSLYSYSNYKLMEALNFMSSLTSIGSEASLLRARYLIRCESDDSCVEYRKYVNPSDETIRHQWARNYGFYVVPFNRFCNDLSMQRRFSNLCSSNDDTNLVNTAPRLSSDINQLQQDINLGPVQLLLGL